jgi:hypothetical protein
MSSRGVALIDESHLPQGQRIQHDVKPVPSCLMQVTFMVIVTNNALRMLIVLIV